MGRRVLVRYFIRPTKRVAMAVARALAPQYAEVLRDIQRGGGRLRFQSPIAAIQNNIGPYVILYDDERKIGVALMMGIIGEEGFRAWCSELNSLPPERQQLALDEIVQDREFERIFDELRWPQTQDEWDEAHKAFLSLSEVERIALARQSSFLYAGLFGGFFNTIALMVHGTKLTDLVPRALAGDEEAFLKAVQIDRLLLIHHPYFREYKQRAQDEGRAGFLSKLARREINSPFRGRIRYPGLYMLFGILDSLRWLDDIRHSDLLDLCDEAGLEQYENRIEDVGYLTKRLIEYRRWQKTGTASMH